MVEVEGQGHEQQEQKSLGAGEEVGYTVDLADLGKVYRRDECVNALLEVRCASCSACSAQLDADSNLDRRMYWHGAADSLSQAL